MKCERFELEWWSWWVVELSAWFEPQDLYSCSVSNLNVLNRYGRWNQIWAISKNLRDTTVLSDLATSECSTSVRRVFPPDDSRTGHFTGLVVCFSCSWNSSNFCPQPADNPLDAPTAILIFEHLTHQSCNLQRLFHPYLLLGTNYY